MDVATLAIAPRRVIVVDDGLMDRVQAVLTSPSDWVPSDTAAASVWPEFRVEVLSNGELAAAFTPYPNSPIGLVPPQLLISSSRASEFLDMHLALAEHGRVTLLVLAEAGWRPPKELQRHHYDRMLFLYEPWEGLELLQLAGTLTSGFQAHAIEAKTSGELRQLAVEQRSDLSSLQTLLQRNARLLSQQVSASSNFVELMAQNFHPLLEQLPPTVVELDTEDPLVPMLFDAGASLRRTLSGVCWQHWLTTDGSMPLVSRRNPWQACIVPWLLAISEHVAGAMKPVVISVYGSFDPDTRAYCGAMSPRSALWELFWWAGDLLISDMMLAHSDRGHVSLNFMCTEENLQLELMSSHPPSRTLPEQAQSDPWPSLVRLHERIPGTLVQHEQDQSRPYHGEVHWPILQQAKSDDESNGDGVPAHAKLANGLLMASTMHELTALLLAIRLDTHQVAVWLGDRLPVDVTGYQWVIGIGPEPLAPIAEEAPRYIQWHPGQAISGDWLQERGLMA